MIWILAIATMGNLWHTVRLRRELGALMALNEAQGNALGLLLTDAARRTAREGGFTVAEAVRAAKAPGELN